MFVSNIAKSKNNDEPLKLWVIVLTWVQKLAEEKSKWKNVKWKIKD